MFLLFKFSWLLLFDFYFLIFACDNCILLAEISSRLNMTGCPPDLD